MENRGSQRPSDSEIAGAVPPRVGANEFRVGVFVLAGLVAFMAVLFLMTDPATFRGRYMLDTRVPDAGGVRKGDPVQLKGVNIGRVHRFQLAGDEVVITLEIEGEWRFPVDSRTRVSSLGLLGGAVVEVVPGSANEMAAEGSELPGSAGGGLMDGVGALLAEDAPALIERIERLLSDSTVEAVEGSAVELRRLLGELSTLAREQSDDIAQLTATLGRTASSVERTAGDAGPDLVSAAARADSTLVSLNAASVRFRAASESLDQILARVDRGEGSLGKLATDDALYDNLNQTLQSVRDLLDDIRANPRRYINISVF